MKKDMQRKNLNLLGALISGLVLGAAGSPLALAATSEENDALFKQGMEALEDDRTKTAIEAFHSILSNQPSLHRARLELAVAYYKAYQYAEARKLAQTVLDDPNTPPEVRVTILAFLAQVKQDENAFAERHEVKPSFSIGYMYDSNVNVGPASDIITIGDQTLTLTPGSLERSDTATVVGLGFTHRYQPGKTFEFGERTAVILWQSEMGLYHREYQDEDGFNLTVLSASTGPAWVVLRHWRANIALRGEYIWLSNSELGFFTSINPAITWQFTDGEFTLDATVTDRDYENDLPTAAGGNGGREGTYMAAGPSLGRYFNNRRVAAQIGARALDFDAEEDRFSYDGYELYAGVNVKTWEGGSVYGRVSYRDVEYVGLEPVFAVARDEEEQRYALGVRHEFQDGYLNKWHLGGSVLFSDNDSNVPLYNYDREQIMVNLGRTW